MKQQDAGLADYASFIQASNVKYLESAGAKVVPILYNESEDAVKEKLAKIDGVLYPGGPGGYEEIGGVVFEEIKKFNDEGHFYPAWGTCRGSLIIAQ